MGPDTMRQRELKETRGHKPITGQYPTAMRLLETASIVVLGSGLGGALYGFYVGIPISDVNRFLAPSVLVGLTLLLAAITWRRRIVKSKMSSNPSLQAPSKH
jgi:hypothetical protein